MTSNNSYVPIRNSGGQIVDVKRRDLIDTEALIDVPEEPESPVEASPIDAGTPQPPPTARPAAPLPRRRTGEVPTIFQMRQAETPDAVSAPTPRWQVILASVVLVVLAILAWRATGSLLVRPIALAPATVVEPTSDAADAAPAAPTAFGVPIPVAAVAFDAPHGNVIDALEPGRGCNPIQRPDPTWVQLDCVAAGLVWVRAEKLNGWAAALPALPTPTPTPTPAPTAVYVPRPPIYTAPQPGYAGPTSTPVDWSSLPIAGRAESPDGVLVCESRVSQSDAEACLARLLAETAQTAPGP